MKDQNLTGRLLVATPALEDPHFRRAVVLIVDDDADGTLGVVVNRPSALPVDEVLAGWSAFASAPAVMFDGGPVGAGSGLAIGLPGDEPEPLGWRALEDCAEESGGEPADPEGPGVPGEPGGIVDFGGPGGFEAPAEPEEPEVFEETGEPVQAEEPGGPGAPGGAVEEPGPNGAAGPAAGSAAAGTGARFGVVDLDAPPEVVGGGLGRFRIFAGYAGWGEGQLGEEIAGGAWYVLSAEPDDVFSAAPETLWSRVLRRQGGDLALVATLPDDPSLN
ncbi:hypothetical protein GCM10027440_47180 [Nocardiopsis coralliicola]